MGMARTPRETDIPTDRQTDRQAGNWATDRQIHIFCVIKNRFIPTAFQIDTKKGDNHC